MSGEVYRDAWGIPHLRAGSARELAFAQGRITAYDRAWQIETERHRAQGTTAAFLGPEAVGWDTFARQARLDDTARRCYERLDAPTAAWVDAYVAGVDAGLAEGAARAPEFARAGLAPGPWRPWTPLAVWISTHILFAGFPAKLWRDLVTRALGPGAVAAFAMDGPGTAGSNGWLLTPERTATGSALLAGDPHRFIEAPGVYQQIRLSCPEFDVAGLAVPGVPGLPHFGHAGQVAWAITNAMADYQDLYAERLRRRAEGVQALGPHGWEPVTAAVESIEVAGSADPVRVEILETVRGPVVAALAAPDPDAGPGARYAVQEAVSLRMPVRVGEDLGFSALPALLRARTVADVDRALDGWVEPVNVVQAADTRGGVLQRVAGRVPKRGAANAVRVVPAWEAAHAWEDGWAETPRTGEPAGGIAVMANERGLAAPLGVEFAPPHRARRIRELLRESATWTAKGMAAVHTDTRLGSAGALLDQLAALDGGLSPAALRLRTRLLAWDRRMAADSADAAAYAVLRAAVARAIAAHPALDPLREPPAYPEVFRPWLALVPRVGFALESLLTGGPLPAADRAAAVRAALEETAADREPPPWGELHRLAAWQALPPGLAPDRPGLAGDHDCVLSTSSVPGLTHLSARGPAARYVWDLADRAESRWIVPFGASGPPGDHQRDQLPLWLRGDLVPLVTDWDLLTKEQHPAMTTPPAARREPVHRRQVAGFGTVSVTEVDPAHDIDLIHSWVTEERARFWGMGEADRARVHEIYSYLDELTTHHAYLVHRDGRPVALFQTYDPAADPIGDFYEVEPGDLGVHLLLGPPEPDAAPEPGFSGRLLEILLGFVLADPAVRRLVVEPDARNTRAVERMLRTGFVLGPTAQLPDKPAQFAFFPRPES